MLSPRGKIYVTHLKKYIQHPSESSDSCMSLAAVNSNISRVDYIVLAEARSRLS